MQQYQPPAEVYIGNDTPQQDKFDDFDILKTHPLPHKIKKIKVQFDKNHIVGMNFTYMDGNGKEVKGQSSLKFKPLKTLFNALIKQEFILDDDDFLTEIYGFVSDTINQIGFITYKGKQEKFGHGKGMYFSIHFPCHTFTAAKGGYSKNLEFIAFRIQYLPEYFIGKYCQYGNKVHFNYNPILKQ